MASGDYWHYTPYKALFRFPTIIGLAFARDVVYWILNRLQLKKLQNLEKIVLYTSVSPKPATFMTKWNETPPPQKSPWNHPEKDMK